MTRGISGCLLLTSGVPQQRCCCRSPWYPGLALSPVVALGAHNTNATIQPLPTAIMLRYLRFQSFWHVDVLGSKFFVRLLSLNHNARFSCCVSKLGLEWALRTNPAAHRRAPPTLGRGSFVLTMSPCQVTALTRQHTALATAAIDAHFNCASGAFEVLFIHRIEHRGGNTPPRKTTHSSSPHT